MVLEALLLLVCPLAEVVVALEVQQGKLQIYPNKLEMVACMAVVVVEEAVIQAHREVELSELYGQGQLEHFLQLVRQINNETIYRDRKRITKKPSRTRRKFAASVWSDSRQLGFI
jgi:hypothetical protein